ncbi:MAG: GxGYxYP family putative glycoside hydrolase [Candidatus Borkfalkiaceae bacterium]|nr:GxGYxYP family putative glycoside hydrolase [Christensenellaceae bacterium]
MKKISLKAVSLLVLFCFSFGLFSCGKKTTVDDGREIEEGIVVFDYCGNDPALTHEVGEADDYRVWRVGVEDYNANTVFLANEGVVAAAEEVKLLRGTYRLTAEIAVYGEAGKTGATNLYNPVAALQCVDENGKVVANQHILGSVSLLTDEFTSYSVTFDVLRAGRYDFRVYGTGLNAVAVQRILLESASEGEDVASEGELPVSLVFEESREDAEIVYEPGKLYVYDFWEVYQKYRTDYQTVWDLGTLLATLQGIVNREEPQLYVRFDTRTYQTGYGETDLFWLDYLSEKNFLPGTEGQVAVRSIGTLLRIFEPYVKGLVLWDNDVPATSNVAQTDAGVNDTLPVRFTADRDSVWYALKNKFSVRLDLVGKFTGDRNGKIWGTNRESTGSAKCDAYLWAMEKYILTDLCNPYVMSNYVDAWVGPDGFLPVNNLNPDGGRLGNGTVAHGGVVNWTDRALENTLMHRDYHVAERAFFVDLATNDSIAPIDDPGQEIGTDAEVLAEILTAQNKRAVDGPIEIGGGNPWALKYSDHVQAGAASPGGGEGIASKFFTKYNVVWTPDSFGYANSSVYRLYEPVCRFENKNAVRMRKEKENAVLENKNYVMFYMGDYDAASWLNRSIPTMFRDPRLGDYPLCWPIIPVNEPRAAHVFQYMYENATENDYFVGGNNGYGYNYWTNYAADGREGLNGTLEDYVELIAEYNRKYDIDIMGTYFSGEDFNTMSKALRNRIYDGLAELYPSGVAVLNGSRTVYRHNGVVFTGKDPGKVGKTICYQAGVLKLLTDDAAEYSSSLKANAIDVTELGRPMFHVCRVILVTPTDLFNSFEALQNKYPDYQFEIVDPYTFFKLYGDYRDRVEEGYYPEIA